MSRTPLPPSPWDFDSSAWPDDDCVAAGADLEPSTIIDAYRAGVFPMPHEGELLWWSPRQRGVLCPGDLRITRSLRKSVRRLSVTTDESFAEVVDACADPSRPGAWIDSSIRAAYIRLNELGWAHSIETRDADGTLVGGLYGLSIGGLFAGESMFHHSTDASKVALVELVRLVGEEGLIDVQWSTGHLASLGVRQWPRRRYLEAVAHQVVMPSPALWA